MHITQAALRQHRAKQRDAARNAEAHLHAARVKIRSAVWQVWTRRTLVISGPQNYDEDEGILVPIRGEALAPLSRRDMWVLKLASRLAKHEPELASVHYFTYRHVLDWLHVGTEDDPLYNARTATAQSCRLKFNNEADEMPHETKRKSKPRKPRKKRR